MTAGSRQLRRQVDPLAGVRSGTSGLRFCIARPKFRRQAHACRRPRTELRYVKVGVSPTQGNRRARAMDDKSFYQPSRASAAGVTARRDQKCAPLGLVLARRMPRGGGPSLTHATLSRTSSARRFPQLGAGGRGLEGWRDACGVRLNGQIECMQRDGNTRGQTFMNHSPRAPNDMSIRTFRYLHTTAGR